MDTLNSERSSSPSLTNLMKACGTCHKTNMNVFTNFKNCDSCREKNRRRSELTQKRKKERQELYALAKVQLATKPPEDSSSDAGLKENTRDGPVATVTSTGAMKRKKALNEMEGEEQRVALGLMKNGLKQVVKGNKRVVSPITRVVTTIDAGKEYQSATAMYESLKKRAKKCPGDAATPKFLQFHGFHSIVAVSTIDNQKRVDMVANDLRKIVRVPFEHSKPGASYNFETMGRTLSFKCTCLGETAPAPAAVSAKPMKGTQGDLIRQARARAALEGIPRVCGGTIKITAVDDGRHPLGILGQRISISVEHPGGASGSKAK